VTRIYYASDVHGSEKLWRKFVNAASFYSADVLVLGGDLTGKVLVPLVERGPGHWEARVFGKEHKAKRESQVEELERRIRLNGFYPLRCTPAEYERLDSDDSYRDQTFKQVMRAELERWLELARDKLQNAPVKCVVMPGNDDEWDIDDVLEQASDPVLSCGERVVRLDGYQMLSSAWANPTPWDSPREAPEEELAEKLEKLAAHLEPDVPAIFNLHCPPYDSGLDLALELTDDLHVVRYGGEPRMVPVGSVAVREFIERHRPVLGLHGHIHESRGAAEIAGTLCINPGSAYAEGVLDGAVVDLEGDRVVSHQLVSG
jgi:Icc-related predicted phosphoesterase